MFYEMKAMLLNNLLASVPAVNPTRDTKLLKCSGRYCGTNSMLSILGTCDYCEGALRSCPSEFR